MAPMAARSMVDHDGWIWSDRICTMSFNCCCVFHTLSGSIAPNAIPWCQWRFKGTIISSLLWIAAASWSWMELLWWLFVLLFMSCSLSLALQSSMNVWINCEGVTSPIMVTGSLCSLTAATMASWVHPYVGTWVNDVCSSVCCVAEIEACRCCFAV